MYLSTHEYYSWDHSLLLLLLKIYYNVYLTAPYT